MRQVFSECVTLISFTCEYEAIVVIGPIWLILQSLVLLQGQEEVGVITCTTVVASVKYLMASS